MLVAISLLIISGASYAQNLKFGHINMQEIVFLMDEMDSARVVLEKYNKDIQDTYNAMLTEYQTKVSTYQQMAANWTPATQEAKANEIQNLEQRLNQYQQSAQMDLQNKQQELIMPIQQKASEAVNKVGRTNGFTYIYDLSIGAVIYFDEQSSIDVSNMVKKELNIPLDKKLPMGGQQQAQ